MPRHDILPAFSFPTTVLWIDDDAHLPESVALTFARDMAFKFFTSPSKIVHYLNEEYHSPLAEQHFFSSGKTNPKTSQPTIELNITSLHQMVFNPNRFDTIASVIVDYAMPDMNGIRCSEAIRDTHIHKIMLTGEADHSIAVAAFNKGIIHKFLLKSADDMTAQLKESLAHMQHDFFVKHTGLIVKALAERVSPRKFALCDPHFIDFFQALCQHHQIDEYYLMDEEGSFLLVDRHGKLSYLAVLTEETAREYVELAEDVGAPQSVLLAMSEKLKIPCLFGDRVLPMFPSRWEPYLLPCQVLDGQQRYFYSYLDQLPASHPLLRERAILSYQTFLEQQEV